MRWLKGYRSSRAVAWFLLLLALLGSPHKQRDDSACLPVVPGEHDASKHAFAPVVPIQHEHCAICHWMRGLKPSFRVTVVTDVVLRAAADVAAAKAVFWSDTSATRLPARAPPLTLL